jgi:hypothetical protein
VARAPSVRQLVEAFSLHAESLADERAGPRTCGAEPSEAAATRGDGCADDGGLGNRGSARRNRSADHGGLGYGRWPRPHGSPDDGGLGNGRTDDADAT